jgi:hypothetical protein
MPLSRIRTVLVSLAAIGLVATAALAQSANYSSFETTSDKPVQLGYYASAHKNCTPGSLPTVRVLEAPKGGLLVVRRGVLSTDKVAGCPGLKTPAQIAFYQPRTGYVGPDRLSYEVTNENGDVATYEMTITVKAPPAPNPPTDEAKGKSL